MQLDAKDSKSKGQQINEFPESTYPGTISHIRTGTCRREPTEDWVIHG